MTRFPNPFAAIPELVAKAFTILGNRDGAEGRSPFVVGVSRSPMPRASRAPTPRELAASTPVGSNPNARRAEQAGTSHQRRFTDPR